MWLSWLLKVLELCIPWVCCHQRWAFCRPQSVCHGYSRTFACSVSSFSWNKDKRCDRQGHWRVCACAVVRVHGEVLRLATAPKACLHIGGRHWRFLNWWPASHLCWDPWKMLLHVLSVCYPPAETSVGAGHVSWRRVHVLQTCHWFRVLGQMSTWLLGGGGGAYYSVWL